MNHPGMLMEYVRTFHNLDKGDVEIAGGKGASLGEMTKAGIAVPPGFVVLSGAFEKFLADTKLDIEIDAALDAVNHEEMHTVEEASEKIQALIIGAEMPADIGHSIIAAFHQLKGELVAVRSSATAEDSSEAAWAGQLETFLNTSEDTLLDNVKRCWASLFSPRAIFYRFEKGLHKSKVSVAVVVQKMIQSEISGIAFSVHPVTQDRNQLIIEAGYGLGEAIVSGQITPDSYVVDKADWHFIDVHLCSQEKMMVKCKDGGTEWKDVPASKREKQILTDDEIVKLSKMIVKIEKHYGFPVDVEWGMLDDELLILQSRPITTLK
jgi:pyruvate,water dikinase